MTGFLWKEGEPSGNGPNGSLGAHHLKISRNSSPTLTYLRKKFLDKSSYLNILYLYKHIIYSYMYGFGEFVIGICFAWDLQGFNDTAIIR